MSDSPKIVNPGYPAPTSDLTSRDAGSISDAIIHHTAGPKDQTPLDIDAFERTRGDVMIPYTYLIDDSGTIYSGRPPLAVSAASFGRNRQSIAICLIGDFQVDDAGYNGPPSVAALTSLYDLLLWVHRQYPSIIRTYPHGSISSMFYGGDSDYATECAGDELNAKVMDPGGIKSRIAAILQAH
jgi:hypothetical protein